MPTAVVLGTQGRPALPLTTSMEWELALELAAAQQLPPLVLALATRPHVKLKTTPMVVHALGALLVIVHLLMRGLVAVMRVVHQTTVTAHPIQTVVETARLVTATTQGVPMTQELVLALERRF